uniref:Uncharacterized protein n=1 Tax=Romanomermis culicivorax TaxID=13658 RepID=A0A915IFS3_ROMCU
MPLDEEFVLLVLRRRKRQHLSRRWYVHPVNQNRYFTGQYHSLILELEKKGVDLYMKYFRMPPAIFAALLSRVGPELQKKSTHKMPIGPAERLALTLQYFNKASSTMSGWYERFLRLNSLGSALRC